MAGFLLAATAGEFFVLPALSLVHQLSAQSQAEFSALRVVQFSLLVVALMIAAALRAAFQGALIEVRLRLGLAWVVASVAAGFASFLLIAGIVQLLPPGSRIAVDNLAGISILSPIPSLFAGIAGWLVLRRLPRAPILLVAFPVAAIAAGFAEFDLVHFLVSAPFAASLVAQALVAGIVIGAIEGVAVAWILGATKSSRLGLTGQRLTPHSRMP